MSRLEIFDPPMCCSTGVCGPTVDAVLPQFAADIEWLRENGITVCRYNLAQDPNAFTSKVVVLDAIQRSGTDCLPLILVDGEIVAQGGYPSRAELATYAGLGPVDAVESKAMKNCVDALDAGKFVLLCIKGTDPEDAAGAMLGIDAFHRDERHAMSTSVIAVGADAPAEAAFVRDLGIEPALRTSVTILLAPPNRVVCRLHGPTDRSQIEKAVEAALTPCCPGSGCCA